MATSGTMGTQQMSQSLGKPSPARSSRFLAAARIVAFALWSLLFLVVYLIARAVAGSARGRAAASTRWSRRWASSSCWLIGVCVTTRGTLPPAPALLAPNHLGYLDILVVMGAVRCFLLTRADVGRWPGIGLLARASGQPFVTRQRGRDVADSARQIAERLALGQHVTVFLEGTSSGGDRVLPFMPSLVEPARAGALPLVPVGLNWRPRDPAIDLAEDVAYWKDHEFGPHAWRALGLRGLHVEVVFGEPIATAGRDRKSLAAEARSAVAALTGLPELPRADTQDG